MEDRPDARRPWPTWLVVVLIAACVLSRAALVGAFPLDWRSNSQGDELFYHDAAAGLVDTGELAWHGSRAWQPPAYPALVALAMRVFPGPELAVQVAQNLLLLAAVLLLARFAAARLGALSGWIVASLVLLNPTWAHAPQTMMSETLFAFEIVAGVLCAERALRSWRARDLVLTGSIFGLAALTREIALLYVLVVGVVLFLGARDARGAVRAARGALLAVGTAIVVVLPWTIRNARLYEAFVPVTVNASFNAYIGNHEGATGGYEWTLPEDARAPWDARAVDPRNEIEAARACREAAWTWIASHPWTALYLTLEKAWILWGPTPVVDEVVGPRGLFQRARYAFWPPFAVCAILGCMRARRDTVVRLLVGFALATSVVHMSTLAMTRYRWPLEILAAYPALVGARAILDWTRAWHVRLSRSTAGPT